MRLQLSPDDVASSRSVIGFFGGATLVASLFVVGLAHAEEGDHKSTEASSGSSGSGESSSGGGSDLVTRATSEISTYQDNDHVSVFTPSIGLGIESPTGGWNVHGNYLVDVVSAASVDVVSTASTGFHEVRHAGGVSAGYKPHDLGVNVAGSVSREPDYLSIGGGGSIEQDFAQKNVTLLVGYGYGHDTIGRGGTSFDVFSRTLYHHAFNAALTVVVDPKTLITISTDAIFERGDQSKPYRYVPMFSPDVAASIPNGASTDLVNKLRLPERPLEQLPTSKDRFALTWRLAQRIGHSTMRISERLYEDSWGLKASTTDARYIVDATERVAVWPHLRLHIQTPVSFWQRAYESRRAQGETWTLPTFRTGDRELGPLGAVTGGGGFKLKLGRAADPNAFAITTQVDVIWTDFSDDIYITNRLGMFAAVTFDAEL